MHQPQSLKSHERERQNVGILQEPERYGCMGVLLDISVCDMI